jgi:hypothetical protein
MKGHIQQRGKNSWRLTGKTTSTATSTRTVSSMLLIRQIAKDIDQFKKDGAA